MDKNYLKMIFKLLAVSVVMCSLNLQAKVAYLPMIKPEVVSIVPLPETVLVRDTILLLDLESFTVLKEINFGIDDFYGSVFLNPSDTKLYVAGVNHIYIIDTTTLNLEEALEVPVTSKLGKELGVSPQINQIFLNNQGDTLYYSSNFSELLHQVNLTTKEVTVALDFENYTIDEINYNESLNTVIFRTDDFESTDTNFHVFDLNGLVEIAENEVLTSSVELISNDGLDYYHHDTFGTNVLNSRNVAQNTLNWSFELEDVPLFVHVFENTDNTISVISREYTYRIDKTTGEGVIESQYNVSDIQLSSPGGLKKIDDNSIFSARPISITCAEPTEVPLEASRKFCIYNTGAHAYINNIAEKTNHLIFVSDVFTGTSVDGRFIGERKYFQSVTIPVISTKITIFLFITLILMCAFYFEYIKKYKQIKQ